MKNRKSSPTINCIQNLKKGINLNNYSVRFLTGLFILALFFYSCPRVFAAHSGINKRIANSKGLTSLSDLNSPVTDSVIAGEYLVKFKAEAEELASKATKNGIRTSATTSVHSLVSLENRFNFKEMSMVGEDLNKLITLLFMIEMPNDNKY